MESKTKALKNKINLIAGIIVAASILAIAISIFVMLKDDNADAATAAFVDGQPIAVGELAMEIERNRSVVFGYFQKTYKADVNVKGFWEKTYGTETPENYIKRLALDSWVRIKVEQGLALKNGILSDISYKELLDGMKKENTRRENAIKNNQVVMGVRQYDKYGYFKYTFDEMQKNLKEKLADTELKSSDEELQKLYEELKGTEFKNIDDVKIQKIFIPFENIAGNEQATKDKVQRALDELKGGGDFESVAVKFNLDSKVITEEFNEASIPVMRKVYNMLIGEANKLSPGEVSGIIEDNGGLNIIKCIEKEEKGSTDFSYVVERLKDVSAYRKYEAIIDMLVKEAKLEVVEKEYNKLQVR